jgi:diguanylate cyclase (GGDEF)-like protein/PAS domain S-box-containing protein
MSTTPVLAVTPGPVWPRLRLPRPRYSLAASPTRAGLIATSVGIIVLAGWTLKADILKSVFLGQPLMKPNAAVIFVLIGAGVAVMSRPTMPPWLRSTALVSVGAGVTIALITGYEYVVRIDFGLDHLLFRDQAAQIGLGIAGRMSPLTVICFILIGFAALVGSLAPRFVIAAGGSALALSCLNVLTVLYGATPPSFLEGYTQMAVSTAVVMASLAVGVVGLLGPASPFANLTGSSTATLLLRRALAFSVFVPIVMVVASVTGEELGFYGTTYGIALSLLGMMAVGVIAVLRSARWVQGLEAKRVAVEVERDRFFELSLDMLVVVSAPERRFMRVNGAWQTTMGYRTADLVGRSVYEFIHPDDVERTKAEAIRKGESGDHGDAFQVRLRHADGTYRWVEWVSRTAPDGASSFAIARDVTDRKRGENRRAQQQRVLEYRNETLEERAIRDPLTGLHNRRFFDRAVARLERAWTQLPESRRPPVSVVIFDLDHFGQVNKQYGHQAGDVVLRLFAGILKKRFREGDLVVRFGGEEFVAVLEGVSPANAIAVAETVRTAFEALSIDIGTGVPIKVTVSAGVAPLGDDRSISAGLAVADVWLSQAKRAGRNQIVGL